MLYKCSSDPCTRRFPRRHGTYLVGQEWEGALGTFVYLEKTCLSRYIVIETPAAFYLPRSYVLRVQVVSSLLDGELKDDFAADTR